MSPNVWLTINNVSLRIKNWKSRWKEEESNLNASSETILKGAFLLKTFCAQSFWSWNTTREIRPDQDKTSVLKAPEFFIRNLRTMKKKETKNLGQLNGGPTKNVICVQQTRHKGYWIEEARIEKEEPKTTITMPFMLNLNILDTRRKH